MKKPPFKKILIANRGEIALRIIRACHELGIKTVAIHSTADVNSLHVKIANESVCIGPAPANESYLNVASIMSAAIATGVDAIHPGYGFLSENAEFAEVCGSCGIAFIGPTVRNMRMLGDKAKALRAAEKAGLPIVAGDSRGVIELEDAIKIAESIGYPVILKGCAGGGGRGMKVVSSTDEMRETFPMASQEVEKSFRDPHLLVEKYLTKVKHLEVQIAGDNFQNVVHFGVRDCSLQRRYQKIIEEAPATFDSKLINKIQEAAVSLARAVNYTSLGTVEFLLDVETQKFYFIEMNTRLQVEHPVTEAVTDVDLVKEQIRIAAGEELSYDQGDIKLKGYAMEVRINAEDPKTLIPSPGIVESYHAPGGRGVRVESALYSGYEVSPYYDSLIAKLIVRDDNRENCIKKMLVALDEFVIDGIKTNIDLHRKILSNSTFRNGLVYTKFLEEHNVFEEK